MKWILLAFLFSTMAGANSKLLLIGGGNRPVEAMKQFMREAGGKSAKILVIPWASESIATSETIKAEFLKLENATIEVVPHRLSPSDQLKLISSIEQATGIFFAGGDQNILMSFIKEYKIKDLLKKRFAQGVMFGGTSAGTAIMSNPMLSGKADLTVINGSQVELTEGLGLLPPGVIVDQHFIIRQRFNRMAGLMLDRKGVYGIAVDENSSLFIIGREAKVIGPTQVLIFKPIDRNRLEVSVMEPNKIFNL